MKRKYPKPSLFGIFIKVVKFVVTADVLEFNLKQFLGIGSLSTRDEAEVLSPGKILVPSEWMSRKAG